jgi:hypothetical protein
MLRKQLTELFKDFRRAIPFALPFEERGRCKQVIRTIDILRVLNGEICQAIGQRIRQGIKALL